MLMGWTDDLAAKVESQVAKILNEPTSFAGWEAATAERTKCLPVYADMGGAIILSAAGELLGAGWDDDQLLPLQEQTWKNMALVSLARKYPELSGLLPARPDHASTCAHCKGEGWINNIITFCGECGGLGWVDEPSQVERAG